MIQFFYSTAGNHNHTDCCCIWMQLFIITFAIYLQSDASLEMEKRHFYQASLEYVFRLQEVQERKKFEFVETVSLVRRSEHIMGVIYF